MSLQKTNPAVHAVRKRGDIIAGGKVQVPWGGINEWRKAEQVD